MYAVDPNLIENQQTPTIWVENVLHVDICFEYLRLRHTHVIDKYKLYANVNEGCTPW